MPAPSASPPAGQRALAAAPGAVSDAASGAPSDLAARAAASRLTWLEVGRSERCAWGRCQGSDTTPYRTVVLAPPGEGSACTCPSRRTPCKHGLALMQRWADGELPEAPEPEFARREADRLTRGRAETDDAGPRRPADPEAAARRAAQRRDRVEAGLAELQRWLADQVRGGLAALPRAGYPHVDAVAARMVDAQAPGVAGVLRSVPADLVGSGWPERMLHQLAGLHLLARAHERLDELPAGLAATVRSRVGYPVTKDDVLAGPGVVDLWWPVGQVDTVDFQLESRRVWLRGARTGRWALWLTFAPPGQSLDPSVQPGVPVAGELHFYPGSGQYRALVGRRDDAVDEAPLRAPGETLAEVRSRYAALLAEDPWASRMPAVVAGVPLTATLDHGWRLRDRDGAVCPLLDLPGEAWPLLAQSGGEPLDVFGEWSSAGLVPLSVLPDDRGRRFTTAVCG